MTTAHLTRPLVVEAGTPSAPRIALGSLTGLRGIAALVVFLYHLRNMQYFGGGTQTALSVVFGAGASAVSLFFILSGFVLAFSYRPQRVREFYRRRFARIYPLHLVGVALALWVGAIMFPAIRTSDPLALVSNVLLVNPWRADWWQAGNPVAWSLACEAFFYLCFPVLIRLIAGRSRRVTAAILVLSIAAAWIVPAAITALVPHISAYSFPPARLAEFVAGIAAALLVRDHGWRIARLAPAVLTALGGYASASLLGETPFGAGSATCVGFVLLIVALAGADIERRATGLSSRVMQKLGAASFAFYIVHLLILQSVMRFLPPERTDAAAAVGAAVALAIALGLAFVLHRGVEQPAHDLLVGRSARRRSRPSRAVVLS